MIKLFAAALAFSCLGIRELSAQAPTGGVLPTDEKTLQMVIDSGIDQPILCESHEGIPEAVALVAGQPAEITLRFPANTAGGLITVSPLDGGQIDLDEGVTIHPMEASFSIFNPVPFPDCIASRSPEPRSTRFPSTRLIGIAREFRPPAASNRG